MINNDYSELLGQLTQFIKSEVIVEIGVSAGDTTLKLCEYNKNAHIWGYDIWDINGHLDQFTHNHSMKSVENSLRQNGVNNFTLYQIDTIGKRKEFERKLASDLNGRQIDLAFVDAEHSYIGIKNDFEIVYPHLADHGVVAFHDTLMIDGCREFMLDLRTKYFDGSFDVVDFPFGLSDRRCGVSLLVKRSYAKTDRTIDQVCGSLSDPATIENNEVKWLNGEIKKYHQNSFNYNKLTDVEDLDGTLFSKKLRHGNRKRGGEW